MSGWVVRQFRGIAPRVSPRLLGDAQAQACANVVFKHGSLVPLRANSSVLTLTKTGTIQSIHRFGQDVANDAQYWFHWAADVDVVRGPVAGDVQERTYWSGDGVPKVTDSSIALTGGTAYPMASYTLGVPAPSTAPVASVGGTPTDATALAETRLYVVTLVTAWGEEGCPSDASNAVLVQVGQTVSLTLPAAPGGSYHFASKRIYRSVPGSLGTPYLFVAEVPVATASYDDTKLAAALGEELPSLDYSMPPAGLTGLASGANGVMAGFVGKDFYPCEPFKPHAWPETYVQTVDADIVGIAAFDTSWLILTKSVPYVVSGTDPASYAMTRSDLQQACVSKRSIAVCDAGVVFASPDGLFLVGGGGARNLTAATHSRREWQALSPSSLHGYVVDNQYVGFYGGTAGFILDLETGDFAPLDWYASAGFYDPIRDALFLVVGGNGLVKFDAGAALTLTWKSKPFYSPHAVTLGGARVEAAGYPITFKAHAQAKNSTDAAAIRAAQPLLTGTGSTLTYTATVADDQPFRLPDGFSANIWEIEVSGAAEIFSAGFASTIQELASG